MKYFRNYKQLNIDKDIYKGHETWDRRKIVWMIIKDNPGCYRYEICEAYSRLTNSIFKPNDDRNYGCTALKYVPEMMRKGYLEREWETIGKDHRTAYYTTNKIPDFADIVDTLNHDSWDWVGDNGEIKR